MDSRRARGDPRGGAVAGALKQSPALRFDNTDVGLAGSAYLAGAVLGAMVFGWLTNRLGRVGERNVAEIERVMRDYFHARDALEAVTRHELLSRLEQGLATVLDVRPEDEFTRGHLPGALNIPLAELERRLAEVPTDREVIAYCRGPYCVLSFEAVALLRPRGFLIRRLEDGFPGWQAAGLPMEAAAP